ncbi:MAG: nucleotidyltransferase domain-containing protein [Pseudomonadota bacterium]
MDQRELGVCEGVEHIMDSSKLKKILEKYFKRVSKKLKLDLVFLYGSWAHGKQRRISDVDIAVLFSDEHTDEEKMLDVIGKISVDLSELLGLEVNILRLKKEFDHPMVYYNASVKGIPVYVKNKDLCDRYLFESIAQMEDFCLFGTAWQILASKVNLRRIKNA